MTKQTSGRRRVAGERRLDMPGGEDKQRSGLKRALLVAGSAILPGVLIAWLTPAGPALWKMIDPPPTVSRTVTSPDPLCTTFLIPGSPSSWGPSPDPSDLPEWALSRGGVETAAATVMITVTGYEERPVTLTGLRFEVARREPPLEGTFVSNQCGDAWTARYASVDLNETPPRIISSSAVPVMPGSIQETTPLRFPYRVSDTESESLLILAHSSGYVEWTAHLEWSNGEDSGALTIDDKGKPFRTTSFIEGREIIHPDGAGGWRE